LHCTVCVSCWFQNFIQHGEFCSILLQILMNLPGISSPVFAYRLAQTSTRLSMLRNVVWAISNVCRGKNPPPDFAKVCNCSSRSNCHNGSMLPYVVLNQTFCQKATALIHLGVAVPTRARSPSFQWRTGCPCRYVLGAVLSVWWTKREDTNGYRQVGLPTVIHRGCTSGRLLLYTISFVFVIYPTTAHVSFATGFSYPGFVERGMSNSFKVNMR